METGRHKEQKKGRKEESKKAPKKGLESSLGAAWQAIRAVCYAHLHERRIETGRNKERKKKKDTCRYLYTVLYNVISFLHDFICIFKICISCCKCLLSLLVDFP